ncbi:nitroreductase family deazaflavin-dependent oxidoreductase [Sphaerisporangium album]|uniref:Nitroreductase family deazaflavin-dependent oxidoreductase n=1 Tax=Sphaerisporangium album TaxID=509200 RepID=A0A367FLQ9_9ACTN|nr:nitroreductase/quinone reductase family protein [Sphaerisporangium album]RCG30762.1 nitroreductase family deazaflavin-dependent oxidoreductase [Sphaerisporangium album]
MSTPHDQSAFNSSIIEEFRTGNGLVKNEMLRDVPLVLLTTTGARTGRSRTTPLGFLRDGPGRIVLWASAMAAPSHPAWYHNLVADPHVTIELRTDAGVVKTFQGIATTAQGAERERLFGVLQAANPGVADHQSRTEREIPLVIVEYTD